MRKASKLLLLLLPLVLGLLLAPNMAGAYPGEVLHLSFSEGSGTVAHDVSGNGNDGTLYNGTIICSDPPTAGCPTWADGKFGQALSFDGVDDYVDSGNDTSLEITDALTVEAWINAPPATGSYQSIVSKFHQPLPLPLPPPPATGWHLGTTINNGVYFELKGSGTAIMNDSINVRDNIWHHIVGVWTGNQIRVYVDGNLIEEKDSVGYNPSTYPLYVGRRDGFRFNGTIDEVRIYNRALSEEEIKQHYEANLFHQSDWSGGPSPLAPDNVTNQSYGWDKFNDSVDVDYTLGNVKLASIWDIETVDSGGNVGLYTSIALDSNNYPHIAYRDDISGDLKYAKWNGNDWEIEVVVPVAGYWISLALDSNNYPHISYSTWDDLKYVKWDGTNWLLETVDSVGNPWHNSLALDSADNPRIGYTESWSGDLKYARWDGTNWIKETVDSPPGGIGDWPSLALASNNYPHISYYSDYNLRYVRWDGTNWIKETVDTGGTGWYTSLTLDSSNFAHISYYDSTNSDLKYANWNGINWLIETVDSGDVGLYTSIALGTDNYPHISYYDSTNDDLKYAKLPYLPYSPGNLTSSVFDSGAENTEWGNVSWGATLPTTEEYAIDTDTIALLHLNNAVGKDTTTLAYDETGVNHGTLSGATWTTDSKFGGYALDFDGSSNVDFGNVFKLQKGTIEMWIKPGTMFDGRDTFSIYDSNSNYAWVTYYPEGDGASYISPEYRNTIVFRIMNAGASYALKTPAQSVSPGTWHHVAVTFGPSGMYLYLNGIEKDFNPYTGGLNFLTTNFYLGGIATRNFRGQIDEFRVSNVQRTNFPQVISPTSINLQTRTSNDLTTGWSDWSELYRKPIVINDPGGILTDYQVNVTVDTVSLIAAGKMRDDCGDIRFRDATRGELPYFLESGCNTAATKIWVKVPSVPTGSSTIYMHYGNPTAASQSNGSAVFEFFDDFSSDLSKWTVRRGSWSIESGAALSGCTIVNYNCLLISSSFNITDGVLEARAKLDSGTCNFALGIGGRNPVVNMEGYSYELRGSQSGCPYLCDTSRRCHRLQKTYISTLTYNTNSWLDNVWYNLKVIFNGTNISGWSNDQNFLTITDDTYATGRIMLISDEATPIGGYFDDVRVRKYASPEPSSSVGTEESAYTNPAGEGITSPSGRYIQYKAFLSTEDPAVSPILNDVTITYTPPAPVAVVPEEEVSSFINTTTNETAANLTLVDANGTVVANNTFSSELDLNQNYSLILDIENSTVEFINFTGGAANFSRTVFVGEQRIEQPPEAQKLQIRSTSDLDNASLAIVMTIYGTVDGVSTSETLILDGWAWQTTDNVYDTITHITLSKAAAGTVEIWNSDATEKFAELAPEETDLWAVSSIADLNITKLKRLWLTKGLEPVDFVWIEPSGFLQEGNYTAKITLPATYDVVYWCENPKENPQKCELMNVTASCDAALAPCFMVEAISQPPLPPKFQTVVYLPHFTGAGGAEDVAPPQILGWGTVPEGFLTDTNEKLFDKGTENVTLQLNTDEAALCRYDKTAGTSYVNMSFDFDDADYTSIPTVTVPKAIAKFENGTSYDFYIRCIDPFGNNMTEDLHLRFTISEVQLPTFIGNISAKFVIKERTIALEVGKQAALLLQVRNPTAVPQIIPIYLGAIKEIKNWVWFSGHEFDPERRNLTVILNPGEEMALGVNIMPAKAGDYELLVRTGPFPENQTYDTKLIKIVPAGIGALGTAPGLSWIGFLVVLLAALFLLRKKLY